MGCGKSSAANVFEQDEFSHGNIFDFYTQGEVLGEGAFAVVRSGNSKKDNDPVAIKIIQKHKLDQETIDMLRTEVRALRKARHPNIISLKEVFDVKNATYLVMERVTGGELFDVIVTKGHFSERDASKLVHQVVQGIHFLHTSCKIVHRDLKPENLLFATSENKILKIADFGLACMAGATGEQLFEGASGTPGYVAPEILKGVKYSYKVDVWSIGVIMYIMLCGYPPFHSDDMNELFDQIKSGHVSMDGEVWRMVSAQAKDLIRKMLTVNPNQRISAAEALQHPWLMQGASLSSAPLPAERTEALRQYIARRRLKKAMNAVRITAAMRIQASYRGHKTRSEATLSPKKGR